jgi:hypothetical protein
VLIVRSRFVCATSEGTSSPVLLTSYRRDRGSSELYDNATIWETVRATSAASTFFDPISIGPRKQGFVDGATGANNPIRQLWIDAREIWKSERLEDNIGCIVSIGTGVPSVKKFGKDAIDVFNTLKRIAVETEKAAREFHQEHTDLDDSDRYFRFNVPDRLTDIGLEEISEISTIVDATQYYLEGEVVYKLLRKCAKALGVRKCKSDFTWHSPSLLTFKSELFSSSFGLTFPSILALKAITRVAQLSPDDPVRFLTLAKTEEWQLEQGSTPES